MHEFMYAHSYLVTYYMQTCTHPLAHTHTYTPELIHILVLSPVPKVEAWEVINDYLYAKVLMKSVFYKVK